MSCSDVCIAVYDAKQELLDVGNNGEFLMIQIVLRTAETIVHTIYITILLKYLFFLVAIQYVSSQWMGYQLTTKM